jgi:hypothetical protein
MLLTVLVTAASIQGPRPRLPPFSVGLPPARSPLPS